MDQLTHPGKFKVRWFFLLDKKKLIDSLYLDEPNKDIESFLNSDAVCIFYMNEMLILFLDC
jgi:hypothetical protein